MIKKSLVLFISFLMVFMDVYAQDELTLNSTFSTFDNCRYKTKGIFVAWWDKNFDYEEKADELLNTLVDVQNDCLDIYQMRNPPNPVDGFYYNVYIHNGRDLFPDGWAMGQGTDTNGYPFLTIPDGYANTNNPGLQHEGFHIFQYNANSPGYDYSGDSQWYIEATANWYAALKHPDSPEGYITAICVTYNPQLPMWYTFDNREAGDQGNWQRYCHQYGMNIFINYMSDVRNISPELIVGGFFAETELLPQEYLFKAIGPETFCELYADFAAHNVGGFEFFPTGTASRSYQELTNYGDLNDVHPVVETFENIGTGGEWYRPGKDFVTRAWAYNVYKINNSQRATYTFELNGDAIGNEEASAVFQGRIVVKNRSSVFYHEMDKTSLTRGSYTYSANPDDNEIFLIIISTPDCFRGNQKFSYEVKIDRSLSTGNNIFPIKNKLGENYPDPFDNTTHIPYELTDDSDVTFTITDLSGRIVKKISEGRRSAGKYHITISADKLKSGVYYYSIKAGEFVDTKCMILR